MRPIMFCGTGSDVGKSVIATAVCRIFKQDGMHPAPFKAQNMAPFYHLTADGKRVARAQGVQAEAAGIELSTDMNPLLLIPTGEKSSEVIVEGESIGIKTAMQLYAEEDRNYLRSCIQKAYNRLAKQYDPIVIEGAGSISEMNLLKQDLVNMSMARYANASVLLVADIDRGGVFASCYGSIMLQSPHDRERIKGIIINKFRGDARLFDEGRKMMESYCGVPVLGVIPYFDDIVIEE
ncbi:MAG: cobyric acid synthase, partial [Segatella salivae]